MKKKVINLVVALVLIAVSVASVVTDNATVRVGAGFGMGERVEDIGDLVSVLEFLNSNSESNITMRNSDGISALAYGSGFNSNKKRRSGHDSATIHVSTALKSSYSSTNTQLSGGVYESTQTFERELTVYITDDATYYVSQAVIHQSKYVDGKAGRERKSYIAQFDFHICVTDRGTYINIHDFMIVDEREEIHIKSKNVDKWIECTDEIASSLISMDSLNREVLGSIGHIIDFLIEEDVINEDDRSVSLDEQELRKAAGDDASLLFVDLKDSDIELKVDLSNSSAPYISLTQNYEHSDKYSQSTHNISGTVETKMKSDERIVIKNIDNTIVDFDRSLVDVSIETIEEFEKLFVIEEKEDENDDE